MSLLSNIVSLFLNCLGSSDFILCLEATMIIRIVWGILKTLSWTLSYATQADRQLMRSNTRLYFYLSNKRIPTIIIFGKIFQALSSYQRPSFIYFWKKSLKNWVKIKKDGYFQKLLYIALQKFQALRYFQTPCLLGFDIFSRPYVYLQPYVY